MKNTGGSKDNRIIVVGGGASGLAAAITAAKSGRRVTILEAQQRVGRKLLATGNGRCNISNTGASPQLARSDSPETVSAVMKAVPPERVMDFLEECGIPCMIEREGRIYPSSEQAASVLDMLRFRAAHLGVETVCEARVSDIRRRGDRFVVTHGGGELTADRIIIACGSQASPQLGGCADGYTLLKSLGHTVNKCTPALAPVLSDKTALRPLKGLRVRCRAVLLHEGKQCHAEDGEVQFNEDNLSGIAIFQISARLARYGCKGREISLDLLPDSTSEQVTKLLKKRREALGYLTLEDFLNAMVHKRVGLYIMGVAGCKPLSRKVGSLTDAEISIIASLLKDWRFPVHGIAAWKQAQLASGGASLRQFDERLQSRLVKGVFACGEVLDCDFDCGGYNLHWAWCSGITAGRLGEKA
ncbi:MAG: aminoacetone oxidase family FAD-binding enzyme [Ruminococcaceae bacterium]|nr:aminoacetone oxidase family FAD-binding enzyme [Oscillospiraceae bacterium]